ncbi:MAG: sulfatase [Carboxylicivirga sp.]|jgi:arylsulfatase A-like enzyme|nr:sulfatase [Carboxylicivirga sp.]
MYIKNIIRSGIGILLATGIMSCRAQNNANVAGDRIGQKERPNIVFILADDYGWKDIGYNGEGFYETPNIDQLANDGIIFTNSYAAGPNCAPSRASLLSGMYTPRHHLFTPGGKSKGELQYMKLKTPSRNGDASYNTFQSNNDVIDPNIICIAELLKTGGYTTARFGKWHIGKDTQGFDISSSNGVTKGLEKKHYGDINVADQLTDAGLEFIESNKENPFFLYISHWDVHTPIRAKAEVEAHFKDKLKLTGGDWNTTYAAMISAVDKSVGRIQAKLKECGLDKNTLVVFASDNGGQPHITSNKPLKGGKGSLFEGGIRVPTCMSWPGIIESGTKCDVPIIGVDFFPTFAELANVPLPKKQPVDGESIVPLIHGEHQLKRSSIYWHYPLYLSGNDGNKVLPIYGTDELYWRATPSTAIRKGDWKLIYYFEDQSVKLYNVVKDVSEKNDLALSNPQKVSELLKEIKKWQKETNAPLPNKINSAFEF